MRLKDIKVLLVGALAPLFGLTACTDDILSPDGGGDGWTVDADGGIVFAVGSTRGFESDHYSALSQSEEEIVINPDNFHVVLFSEKGEVKQIWANQELTEINEFDQAMNTNIVKYYVKIPRQDIASDVVQYIRSNRFKIAVFANWDGYPEFTIERGDDEANGVNPNDIYYISHARKDDSYVSGGVDGQYDDSEIFSFITGRGAKMGIAQEWVSERFKTDADADAAIRQSYKLNNDGTGEFLSNTKPVLTNSDGAGTVFKAMDDYTYYNMWQIWNFGGEKNLNDNYYNSTNWNLRSKWASINNDLYNKCFYNNGTIWLPGKTSARNLSIVSPDDSNGNDYTKVFSSIGNDGYGIVLRNSNRGTSESKTIKVEEGSYIHLKIPADGYMYVKCRSWDYGGATLVARRGNLNSTTNNVVKDDWINSNLQTITYDYTQAGNQIVRVTGEPVDIVLYATGGDVIIYEIDYIKSRTLQTVDRQMINPASTPEGGISMYGVQDFEPVPETVWPDGTTFNLSRYVDTHTGREAANYRYRTISLLRSVAKVEVLVPTSIFPDPSHMYMRTINRFSRSAPIDVFTPTNIIWDGWDTSNPERYPTSAVDAKSNTHYYNQALGVDDEARALRTKGFTYDYNSSTVQAYQNAVAWLFGIWQSEYGWKWNGRNINIAQTDPYPRVFNTRISRSDFAHMINGGKMRVDGEEYYYYYAYLPEKNVTDPNDKGTLNESPKVMRIEMRFGDRNSDDNLDDNASYRIYFTPGGKGNGINSRDDYDDNMEKGNSDSNSVPMQNLKNIYPVMRNHLYRFKITGIEMNELNVDFEVQGPDTRDINYTFQ